MDNERRFEVTSKLAEGLVHHCLSPNVQVKQVGEESLDSGDEALSVNHIVPPVRGKEERNVGA